MSLIPVTTDTPIAERRAAGCSCLDCMNPNDGNLDTRIVHRLNHDEFEARYASPVSSKMRREWLRVRLLANLTEKGRT